MQGLRRTPAAEGRGGGDGAHLRRGAQFLGGCSCAVWGQGQRGAAWGPLPALPPLLPPLPAQGCIISPRRSFACKHNQENIVAPFQALSDMAFLKRPALSVCPPTSVCSVWLDPGVPVAPRRPGTGWRNKDPLPALTPALGMAVGASLNLVAPLLNLSVPGKVGLCQRGALEAKWGEIL